jgi:hypothetical protein
MAARQPYPYNSVPQRASRTATEQYPDVEEDDAFYPQRMPSSTRRYQTTEGHEVIQQGNRRIIIHNEPPPKLKRRWHPLFFVGLVLFAMVMGWIAFTLLANWWQAKQDDWKYGNPRTYQIEQFVGHADSTDHPNHFIAVNINGSIEVVELNTQTPKDDHMYLITTVTNPLMPVGLNFTDVNHDGKVDMVVTIGGENAYSVVLLNNGTQFQPQR